MIELHNWYILPKSEIINGDIFSENMYKFTQEKIISVTDHSPNEKKIEFHINGKYLIKIKNMDGFFKDSISRNNTQIEYLCSKSISNRP